jgi:kynureninase
VTSPSAAQARRELTDLRAEFPAVEAKTYLISASLGPLSRRARRHLDRYLDSWAALAAPEPVWFECIFPQLALVKRLLGELLGASPGQLGIMLNVSHAISSVASALNFPPGRNRIVLSELDFPTAAQIWLAQKRRGAEVVFVPSDDGRTIEVERYLEAIDERTALVCLNRVLYQSGALLDVKPICAAARAAGALSLIDDYHGAGAVPVDLGEVGCDLYTAGVLKWLCGGPGLAFIYARDEVPARLEPTLTGWWGRSDPFAFEPRELSYHASARRFEIGTHAAPVAFLAQGGLELILEAGVERIRERQLALGERVIAQADEAGLAVLSPRAGAGRGGSVTLEVGADAERLAERLFAADVCVDARGVGIRVAPHFFNTEEDVDRLFEVLRAIR